MSIFASPNYTQIPNSVIDDLMAVLTPAEFKCILLVLRETVGYHRRTASIPLTDFMKKCNLSKQGALNSIASIEKKRLVRVGRSKNKKISNKFTIDIKIQKQNTSQLSRPQLVNSVDPYKERKENINDVDDVYTSKNWRETLRSKKEKEFYDRVTEINPPIGDKMPPNEVSFWIKTFGIEKIVIALDAYFEQMEKNKKREWMKPRSMGAYVRGILNDMAKDPKNNTEENKLHIIRIKEAAMKDNYILAKSIKVRKDHVFFEHSGKDYSFNMETDTFRDQVSGALAQMFTQ